MYIYIYIYIYIAFFLKFPKQKVLINSNKRLPIVIMDFMLQLIPFSQSNRITRLGVKELYGMQALKL